MRIVCFLLAAASVASAADVEFNRDIRPILSNNCYACHGPDAGKRMANLRLDVRESAIAAKAIVPGDISASKIVARINHEQPALRMPPSYSTKSLSAEQKQLITDWIAEGAKYEQHWAYNVPHKAAVPAGAYPVDYFINRKLAAKGLTAVVRADRRTLIRRISLDLTGLPPKPADVERFVNDDSPQAYEREVDRLLASPRFGERMAVYWLDLVRYADTTGFHNDVPINVYPYRDYVIRSFNENKPFDQFTREQLGGDLMPNPTDEQLVASAYNRLNRLTTEGGAQPKEYLAKYASDRASTTATVWLGSTLGCAECHDHKFDPFLTKEFYQIEAFFADIEEVGVFGRDGNYGPQHRFLQGPARAEASRIEARLSELRASGKDRFEDTPKNRQAVDKYLEKTAAWRPLIPAKAFDDCSDPDVDGCEDIELHQEAGGFVSAEIIGEEKPRETAHTVEVPLGNETVSAVMLEVHPAEGFDEFWVSRFQLHLEGRGDRPQNIRFSDLVADKETDEFPMRDTLEENPHSGWVAKTSEGGIRRAMWVFEQPLQAKPGETLNFNIIYNGRHARAYPGRFRLYATAAEYPELAADGGRFTEITAGNSNWQQIRPLERELKTLWDFAEEVHIAHAVDEPREMRILPRGDWMSESGAIVHPQTPQFLGEISTDGRRLNRLDLGKWLTSKNNPLTARVYVNRMWRMFFGIGLSKTLDDMGSQGEPPTHPDLLDWLAVDFMESGWDTKHLIRTLLLSDAYQRSSSPSAELREKDPYNRLLGRQGMFRLDAEFIRDSALEVSGLLNLKMGGPSVKPYQPKGYYVELNFPMREYEPAYNADQFRRGVYTHWQRTFLHPSLMAFDAPPREECTAERAVSNTPLQSLTLLNDPSYVETARNLAARMIAASKHDAERINFAFQEAFARPPTDAETTVLLDLLKEQRQAFAQASGSAEQLLHTGISPLPAKVSTTELAAWTQTARAILNKHEFITRY